MATVVLLRTGIVCSVIAFVCMFIAFSSPYWYKSWTRVHSSFGNIGLWHICLNGFIMPQDPVMKSYVGCWWIHSTEFDMIEMHIMPVWFRFVQAFSVFVLIADLLAMIFTILYLPEGPRSRLYKKRPRMFFINSALLLGAAFLVFLIALVFAEMSNDSSWMPRPWMNYLSWSYGLCVVSGFFSAFGGMVLFVLGLVYADKEANGDPGVTSAAELAARQKELEKQDEAMRTQAGVMSVHQAPPTHPQYGSSSGLTYRGGSMGHMAYHQPPPQYGSKGALVGPQYGSRGALSGPQYGSRGALSGPQYGSNSGLAPHRGAYAGSVSSAQYRGQPAQPDRAPSEAGSQSTRVGESFV
ncbi:hypothetical protein PoB_000685200 [Plakobranchus ocellatus]|uniref:Uncharacterized protein n=1 Tax=Plakobranchus ocellatus TaxID=259542 RepID=A0AAV3YE04_9GAST|nr:hypothetical protein PoB_000685200 [Plakobranchus ocellatus]